MHCCHFFLLQKCCSDCSYLHLWFLKIEILRSRIAGSWCIDMLTVTRYCQIIFQNMRVPLSLHPGQHFILSDLKKFTDLMGVICISLFLICIFLIASEIRVCCISFLWIDYPFFYWVVCLSLISSSVVWMLIAVYVVNIFFQSVPCI